MVNCGSLPVASGHAPEPVIGKEITAWCLMIRRRAIAPADRRTWQRPWLTPIAQMMGRIRTCNLGVTARIRDKLLNGEDLQ